MTQLSVIYDSFLGQITDDMYMELTKDETYNMLFDLFENSLHWFEFPRFNLYGYDAEMQEYEYDLTQEEVKIIAMYMIVEWIG